HGRTAKLFQENKEVVSLLVHGNDHVRAELSRPPTLAGQRQMLAQCLRRIHRFETKAQLQVSRSMAPPHGAYGKHTIPAMLSLGFEGAYISPWSLRRWDRDRPWPPSFGLEPAERLDADFPVVPRFRLS